jgi:Protein of unknown function (DUF1579)
MTRPGPEHDRLNVFVGTWNTEGQTRGGPLGPAVRITAVDTYEWFPGGFFLVHHVDARIGDDEVKVIELIGYDASSGKYFTRSFDSQGNAGTYQASVRDRVWTFTGETERATVMVSDDGNTMTAHWERSEDGSRWLPWMDVTLRKAR